LNPAAVSALEGSDAPLKDTVADPPSSIGPSSPRSADGATLFTTTVVEYVVESPSSSKIRPRMT